MSGGAGVQVAPGDPGQISQAAAWHQELADALELHHATITGASNSVLATWNGEAASSYGHLATTVADHFSAASGDARTVASALARYAAELERYQQEGMRALQESEYWLGEQNKWQTKLDEANAAIAKAQKQVSDAQQTLHTPQLALPSVQTAAAGQLGAGQVAMAKGQADQRTAEAQLLYAEQQVMRWQASGRQAWDDAVQAAKQATGAVETVNVAPPPLAGSVRLDRFNSPAPKHGPPPKKAPPPKHHHGGGFVGGLVHGAEHLAKDVGKDSVKAVKGLPAALNQIGTVGLRSLATVIKYSPTGMQIEMVSKATGKTIGGCFSLSGTSVGNHAPSGSASVCWAMTPSGQSGFTVTGGHGTGGPGPSVGASTGPLFSNGKTLGDQGGGFADRSGSMGLGPVSGGSTVSVGRNSQGTVIRNKNPAWAPSVGSPIGVQKGHSNTSTFPAYG